MIHPTPEERNLIYTALVARCSAALTERKDKVLSSQSAGAAIDQVTPKLS